MTDDTVGRREFDKLYDEVVEHRKELTITAVKLGEIQTTQNSDSKKIDEISENTKQMALNMELKLKDVSKDVTLNKLQITKLIAWTTPVYAVVSYAVTKLFIK